MGMPESSWTEEPSPSSAFVICPAHCATSFQHEARRAEVQRLLLDLGVKRVRFVESIGRSPSGKVDYAKLREESVEWAGAGAGAGSGSGKA